MKPRHITIVGGGVIGLSAALALLKRGHHVAVFEREARGRRDNCSSGNAGMIVPSHFIPLSAPGMVAKGLRMWLREPEGPFALHLSLDPELIGWALRFMKACSPAHVARCQGPLLELSLDSRRQFELAAQQSENAFGLVTRGLLMLCRTAEALDEEARVAALAEKLGLPAQVLDAKGVAAADPAVTMDVTGGVLFPQDAHLSPEAYLDWLTLEVERLGADLHHGMGVVRLETRGDRITGVRLTSGVVDVDEIVVAGGAWSAGLLRGAGLSLPLQPGKGYSFTLDAPPQLPGLCSLLVESKVAITPMGGRLRIAGTMEIGRLDLKVNPARLRGMRGAVAKYFPAFAGADLETPPVWTGLRPCSPDGLPYIGRWRSVQNLTIATGHAMMGVTLAPVTGSLVAAAIDDDENPLLDVVRPDRFA